MENLILIGILVIIISYLKQTTKRKTKKPKLKTYPNYKKEFKKQNDTYSYKEFKQGIQNRTKKQKLSRAEKKAKGDLYEKYVSEHFKKLGYTTWEHGLEKGYNDQGIDLFVKKDKEYLFIQCKNWDKWKINEKKIIEYREKARKYMINNPQVSKILLNFNYKIKLVMVTPNDCYTKDAKQYLKENQDIINYQIIPMK